LINSSISQKKYQIPTPYWVHFLISRHFLWFTSTTSWA